MPENKWRLNLQWKRTSAKCGFCGFGYLTCWELADFYLYFIPHPSDPLCSGAAIKGSKSLLLRKEQAGRRAKFGTNLRASSLAWNQIQTKTCIGHRVWPTAFHLRPLAAGWRMGMGIYPIHPIKCTSDTKPRGFMGLGPPSRHLRPLSPRSSGFAARQRGATRPLQELVQCSKIRSKLAPRKWWCSWKASWFQRTLPFAVRLPSSSCFL